MQRKFKTKKQTAKTKTRKVYGAHYENGRYWLENLSLKKRGHEQKY